MAAGQVADGVCGYDFPNLDFAHEGRLAEGVVAGLGRITSDASSLILDRLDWQSVPINPFILAGSVIS
jgi:hypothetical protein